MCLSLSVANGEQLNSSELAWRGDQSVPHKDVSSPQCLLPEGTSCHGALQAFFRSALFQQVLFLL